ncbi:hypothetical protein BN1232_05540 [Mycobacterium lentiflavum]|uniref:Uncharacterized protein n=1 Tax=Mycobacterium lentiflavum TaxID=141349 RepID=A0A0E4H4U7_MYCLN|nr:hypothetical protein [Mycobacterium lentiflavum]CQD22185.1 hypothetical protein BN1232_05540 [Mycobacterium lentiflavum]
MKLVAESGLWTVGPASAQTPLAAVLEVSGAVLSWTIDDPPGDERTQITFTDLSRADWLWRVFGEAGHVALTAAANATGGTTELTGVDIVPGSVEPLRRLAVGHWLRRWWPASQRDGIAGLDGALLDLEVALLTAGAQDFFTDDTLDSDVTSLLAPHAAALFTHARSDDPRIANLVRAGADLADEVGVDDDAWAELIAVLDDSSVAWASKLSQPSGRRDDYALAAGADAGSRRGEAIARGVASIHWTAVPPAIFDAGENTVDWSVEASGAVVRAAIIGPDLPSGVAVRLQSGAISGAGALDGEGRALLPLLDAQGQPMTESAAWDHDWTATAVIVGAQTRETRETRDRIRRWVRARLDRPPADAFLAEIVASESAY